ncbi:MAG TPA: hypothetical protein VFU43_04080 [Streptosporangiaceae bacterium]|nr:hypothetical protein [Streptosporangiaceae bacterium]
MSSKRRNKKSHSRERRFTVRGVRRDPPDIQKLSKALISLAMAEAERQAQAEQAARDAESAVASERDQSGGERDA